MFRLLRSRDHLDLAILLELVNQSGLKILALPTCDLPMQVADYSIPITPLTSHKPRTQAHSDQHSSLTSMTSDTLIRLLELQVEATELIPLDLLRRRQIASVSRDASRSRRIKVVMGRRAVGMPMAEAEAAIGAEGAVRAVRVSRTANAAKANRKSACSKWGSPLRSQRHWRQANLEGSP